MRMRVAFLAGAALALAVISPAMPGAGRGAPAAAQASPATAPGDPLGPVGSRAGPFPQNKQNEPAIAVDANHPNVLVAGANDELDLAGCTAAGCPFTPGVGVSGVYFSSDSGQTWTQPTYPGGWTARDCLGQPGCQAHVGPIGTLPGYFQNGLVADGDPAVAFGPVPDAHGNFSWANGSPLYHPNLAPHFSASPQGQTFNALSALFTAPAANTPAPAARD